jgi:hypothetical protein
MFGMGGLPQLPLHRHVFGSRGFVVYFVDVDFQLHFRRLLHQRRQDSGSWGFVVYFVDINFRFRLRRLLHRRRLACGSRGFIVYLTDVDSSIVFINTYFVACIAQDQGLRHNHQTRGATGIGMSGVTPKHEVLPGDRDQRGRGG